MLDMQHKESGKLRAKPATPRIWKRLISFILVKSTHVRA
jgi:hypothetical protein